MNRMDGTNHSSSCPPEHSFTGDFASSARILVGINVLFCFIGIVGNVMASMAVFSTRSWNLSYHYFLSSLTVAELTLALLCQPLLIALILAQLNSTCIPALQLTFGLIANFASFASEATVALIALNTCLYVSGKFNYTNIITTRKKIALVMVWVMAIVMCVLRTFSSYTEFVGCSWIVISFLSYAIIYHQISSRQNNRSHLSHENPADQTKTAQSGNETPRWQVAWAAITFLLLLSLRSLPMFLFNILQLGKRFDLLHYIMATAALIPSALYPLVYCLSYSNYRRSLKRVFLRLNPIAMKHHKETEETERGDVGQELQSSIESAAVWQMEQTNKRDQPEAN